MASHHISSPTAKEILRYRSHHGVNLGSVFVLEKWLSPHMYDDSVAGDSEHDAVVSSINNIGLAATTQKWQSHWSSAITESDLQHLTRIAHCTTIRLPIGYFNLGASFCTNTPFALGPSEVYKNAWSHISNVIRHLHAHGIGVLVDLHAVPGGANAEIHSGTSSGKAELWDNPGYLDLAKRCLVFLATQTRDHGLEGVVGIQICNEAEDNAPHMYEFYDSVIDALSEIDPGIPVYISDAWNLSSALEYSTRKNATGHQDPSAKLPDHSPIVVDTHRYFTFADRDTSRSPQQLIDQITSEELSETSTHTGGGNRNLYDKHGTTAVFVGEWSCALAPQTWAQAPTSDHSDLAAQLCRRQSQRWREKAGGGAFWTLKHSPGQVGCGEWIFISQTSSIQGSSPNMTTPTWLSLSRADISSAVERAELARPPSMMRAIDEHTSYWNDNSPNGHFEHWRFADGWHLGWCDARDFFAGRSEGIVPSPLPSPGSDETLGADKIGYLDLWILKRMRDEGITHHTPFGWEWEQGYRRGVGDFEATVKI